ncbi:MAG: DNA methylase [Gemmatimonadales bacterium]|nr:DNA methylase [Gemmatimonadales bacterium]
MTIETSFDVEFISRQALREKQIQQNYRPVIAVHKWFARRPGSLFRGLILSEFVEGTLSETFYNGHDLGHLKIADPFMGGGTPLMEANRLGCDVVGADINPMSYWIVQREIEHLEVTAYRSEAQRLVGALEDRIGHLYRTKCGVCGSDEAHAKYFLWVTIQQCVYCFEDISLFPGYLIAEAVRHPANVIVCSSCGDLCETASVDDPGKCPACHSLLSVAGPASRNRCPCPHCGEVNRFPSPETGPPRMRMFAMEYHCQSCKPSQEGRFFKRPDERDLATFVSVEQALADMPHSFIPDDDIPPGDETNRLLRWGYRKYRDTFNARQLLGLELSCEAIRAITDERIQVALATNLSDLVRYQNLLCRYDTMALKSLDVFSVHGFPAGLVRCESNLLGIAGGKTGNIGSGGWLNIIEKYSKAKEYCDRPFEVVHDHKTKRRVYIPGEWIGDAKPDVADQRQVQLHCGSGADIPLADNSLDGVFTDPPYFGSVQYAELMDYCYVWLRRLMGSKVPGFQSPSTRNAEELTGNDTLARGLQHFAEGLAAVFTNVAKALKAGAPLAFTYHHNQQEAYFPVIMAILDAGLVCSASLPCPAEMGASIHISGTGSSVVDTIFVCRSTGRVPRAWIAPTSIHLAELVSEDIAQLTAAGLKVSRGDERCLSYGHLSRQIVWNLRDGWDVSLPTRDKLDRIAKSTAEIGGGDAVLQHLRGEAGIPLYAQSDFFRESDASLKTYADAIPF